MEKPLFAMGGATGSGKTALAITLAKKYPNLVILSADSRQIYQKLDVGTAKIGVRATNSSLTGAPEPVWDIDGVPQFLIDIAEPGITYNLADYQKEAYRLIYACWNVGKIPFLVGGTGLYIQAITQGYVIEGEVASARRTELGQMSVTELQEIVSTLGVILNQSDWRNKHRLVRAIERHESGVTESKTSPITNSVKTYVLERPWDEQRELAPSMVQERLDLGLVDETKQLLAQRIDKEWLKATGLSYRLVIRMLEGALSESELKTHMIHEFRQLMRRQKTWFTRMPNTERGSADFIENQFEKILKN